MFNPGAANTPRKTARLPNGDVADINFALSTGRSTSKVVNVMMVEPMADSMMEIDEVEREQLYREYVDPPELKAQHLRNLRVPIDEYLLYFAFQRTQN